MSEYTVYNDATKRTITFEWNDPNPPTDADMDEIFSAAEPQKLFTQPSNIPSAEQQRSVMGIASPNDLQAAQGAKTFVKEDIPNVASTAGARIGAGIEKSAGGLIQSLGESPEDSIYGNDAVRDIGGFKVNPREIVAKGKDIAAEGRMVAETVDREKPLQTRAGKILGSTVESIGANIPGMTATMVTGNPALGLSMMGLQTFGQAYDEARSKGISIEDATNSAAIQGGTEVATELAPFIQLAKFLKPGKLSTKVLKQYLAEVPGEHVATAVQNATGKYYNDPNATDEQRKQAAIQYLASPEHGQDQIDTFFTTLMQSAIMGGMAKAATSVSNYADKRREPVQDKASVPIPDTGIQDDSMSVDDAIKVATDTVAGKAPVAPVESIIAELPPAELSGVEAVTVPETVPAIDNASRVESIRARLEAMRRPKQGDTTNGVSGVQEEAGQEAALPPMRGSNGISSLIADARSQRGASTLPADSGIIPADVPALSVDEPGLQTVGQDGPVSVPPPVTPTQSQEISNVTEETPDAIEAAAVAAEETVIPETEAGTEASIAGTDAGAVATSEEQPVSEEVGKADVAVGTPPIATPAPDAVRPSQSASESEKTIEDVYRERTVELQSIKDDFAAREKELQKEKSVLLAQKKNGYKVKAELVDSKWRDLKKQTADNENAIYDKYRPIIEAHPEYIQRRADGAVKAKEYKAELDKRAEETKKSQDLHFIEKANKEFGGLEQYIADEVKFIQRHRDENKIAAARRRIDSAQDLIDRYPEHATIGVPERETKQPWEEASKNIDPYIKSLGHMTDAQLKAEEKRATSELNTYGTHGANASSKPGGVPYFEASGRFNAVNKEIEARKSNAPPSPMAVKAKELGKPSVQSQIDGKKRELENYQQIYEKKLAAQSKKRGGMVPPAIKADALKGITDKMDSLEKEIAVLENQPPTVRPADMPGGKAIPTFSDAKEGEIYQTKVNRDGETVTMYAVPHGKERGFGDTLHMKNPVSDTNEIPAEFGEHLGGARRDKQVSLDKEYEDADLARLPLSEIWPKKEIDAIEDTFVAAVSTAARAEVPAKPRQTYKVNRWVEKVKGVRALAKMVHGLSREEFLEKAKDYRLEGFIAKVKLLENIDRSQWGRIGEVKEYPNAYGYVEGKQVARPHSIVEIDGKNMKMETGTVAESYDKVNTFLEGDKTEAKMQFEVRGSGSKFFIMKKGDALYRPLMKFDNSADAIAFIRDKTDPATYEKHYEMLVQEWENIKERENVKEKDLRREENRPRTAKDHRQGKDATPQMFTDAFGFRGVEFGNWVTQGKNDKERQGMLNAAYDAMMDLAEIINVPPQALSLNGTLGLGFGSRGSGWASAHYEPGTLVINLTKTRGAGALAHELFHAIDHYFQRQRSPDGIGREQNYITYNPETYYQDVKSGQRLSTRRFNEIKEKGRFNNISDWKPVDGVRPEVGEAFADLVKALNDSPMANRASLIDKGKSGGYWSRIIERAARSFENYVIFKMQQRGYHNDYLANVVTEQEFSRDIGRYPYLMENEIAPVAEAFDNLFATIKTKQTDKGMSLYQNPMLDPQAIVDSIKGFKANLQEDIPKLIELGKQAYRAGATSYNDFAAKMKGWLADKWDTFKAKMTDVYFKVKKIMKDERGVIGRDINDKGTVPRGTSGTGNTVSGEDQERPEVYKSENRRTIVAGENNRERDLQFSTKEEIEAIDALNKKLAEDHGEEWRNAYEPAELQDVALGEAFERVFGVRVIACNPVSEQFNMGQGFQLGNTLYISGTRENGFVQIAGHELLHYIKKTQPLIYNYFRTTATRYIRDGEGYGVRLNSALMAHETPHTEEEYMEELLSDFAGDALADPVFLQRLEEGNPGKFKMFVRTVINWLRKVENSLKERGFGSSVYFNDVAGLRETLAHALSSYAETKSMVPFGDIVKYSRVGASPVETDFQTRYDSHLDAAEAALDAGDPDKAVEWLDKAAEVEREWLASLEAPQTATKPPKEDDPEVKVRGLAQNVEDKAIMDGLIANEGDLGELPTYKVRNMAEAASRVSTLLDTDYERALRIIDLEEPAPEGLYPEDVFTGIRIRATLNGDVETLTNLLSSPVVSMGTTLGQRIKALDSGGDSLDPFTAMKGVTQKRKEDAEKQGVNNPDAEAQAAEIARLKAELDEANAKLDAKYAEYAVKEIKKKAAKTSRPADRTERKAELDTEFKDLSRQLAKSLGLISANPMFNPETISILVSMARNRIEAGINTAGGVIDSIHEEVKDLVQGVKKRHIRDAISNYGKTQELSKDEVDVTLRELKRQWLLVSKIEDATRGQLPEKTGMQRDQKSDELRLMEKELHQIMKKNGLDQLHSTEEHMKTALDAVKTRLKNEIADLDRQIADQKRDPVQKTGVKYDAEALKLKEIRDEKKAILDSLDAKPGVSEQRRVEIAINALERSIEEYTRQIATGDFKRKAAQDSPETPAIKKLRDERDALKKVRDEKQALRAEMEKEGVPDEDPRITDLNKFMADTERKIKAQEAALDKSIEEYERRIAENDLEPEKKRSGTPEIPGTQRKKAVLAALKETYKQMKKDAQPPKDPEAARLQSLKTRLTNEINKYEGMMQEGLFDQPAAKVPTRLDAEGEALKRKRDQAKENYRAAVDASGTITKEEAAEIVRLSKVVSDARDAMENGGDRLAYGAARVAYENFINDLKGVDAPLKVLFRNRVNEAKTTWQSNKSKAVLDATRDTLSTITDNSIAMVASFDNSFMGRQGLKTLFTHPSAWYPGALKSFSDFVRTLGGANTHDALLADIYSRPNFLNGEYLKAKIIVQSEEQYPTSLPERVPLLGRVFKASEYAFKGSALRMRSDLYDLLSDKAKELGVDMTDKVQVESLGKLINSLTARGKWGKTGEPAVVRLLLWAPKMLKGNIDVLTAHNFGAGLDSRFAQKEAAINLLKIISITASIMALANALLPGSAEDDPRSSDFGKIKIGNTRFDITGGAGSIVTLVARILTRATKSTETGLVTPYGLGYGKSSPFTALIDFLVNKVTPPAGMIISWMKGKNREGEPFTAGDAAYRSMVPISIQNAIKMRDDVSADAVAAVIADLVGINANTYSDTGTQRRDMVNRIRRGKPLTDKQQEAFDKLDSDKKRSIKKDAKVSALTSKLRNLPLADLANAAEVAPEGIKQEIAVEFRKKFYHSKGLDRATRDRYKSILTGLQEH